MQINFFKEILTGIFGTRKDTRKSSINILNKKITFKHLKNNPSEFIDFFYTLPETALEEIKHRNKKGHETKEETKKNIGIVHRDVTPNIEINRMISICDTLDIEPFFFDNPKDKFSCLSRSKYRLAKMVFLLGYNKNHYVQTETKKIITFEKTEGKPLQSIRTIFGENLIEFHKNLFKIKYPSYEKNIIDIATLVKQNKPKDVYFYLFNLSIKNGIFIENFSLHTKEIDFIEKVVFPTFIKVWKKTGYKPLIIPSEPIDIEQEEFWLYYSPETKILMPKPTEIS